MAVCMFTNNKCIHVHVFATCTCTFYYVYSPSLLSCRETGPRCPVDNTRVAVHQVNCCSACFCMYKCMYMYMYVTYMHTCVYRNTIMVTGLS